MERDPRIEGKFLELQRYLPFLEKLRESLRAKKRNPTRDDHLSKVEMIHKILLKDDHKLNFTNLTKCETVLMRLYDKKKDVFSTDIKPLMSPADKSFDLRSENSLNEMSEKPGSRESRRTNRNDMPEKLFQRRQSGDYSRQRNESHDVPIISQNRYNNGPGRDDCYPIPIRDNWGDIVRYQNPPRSPYWDDNYQPQSEKNQPGRFDSFRDNHHPSDVNLRENPRFNNQRHSDVDYRSGPRFDSQINSVNNYSGDSRFVDSKRDNPHGETYFNDDVSWIDEHRDLQYPNETNYTRFDNMQQISQPDLRDGLLQRSRFVPKRPSIFERIGPNSGSFDMPLFSRERRVDAYNDIDAPMVSIPDTQLEVPCSTNSNSYRSFNDVDYRRNQPQVPNSISSQIDKTQRKCISPQPDKTQRKIHLDDDVIKIRVIEPDVLKSPPLSIVDINNLLVETGAVDNRKGQKDKNADSRDKSRERNDYRESDSFKRRDQLSPVASSSSSCSRHSNRNSPALSSTNSMKQYPKEHSATRQLPDGVRLAFKYNPHPRRQNPNEKDRGDEQPSSSRNSRRDDYERAKSPQNRGPNSQNRFETKDNSTRSKTPVSNRSKSPYPIDVDKNRNKSGDSNKRESNDDLFSRNKNPFSDRSKSPYPMENNSLNKKGSDDSFSRSKTPFSDRSASSYSNDLQPQNKSASRDSFSPGKTPSSESTRDQNRSTRSKTPFNSRDPRVKVTESKSSNEPNEKRIPNPFSVMPINSMYEDLPEPNVNKASECAPFPNDPRLRSKPDIQEPIWQPAVSSNITSSARWLTKSPEHHNNNLSLPLETNDNSKQLPMEQMSEQLDHNLNNHQKPNAPKQSQTYGEYRRNKGGIPNAYRNAKQQSSRSQKWKQNKQTNNKCNQKLVESEKEIEVPNKTFSKDVDMRFDSTKIAKPQDLKNFKIPKKCNEAKSSPSDNDSSKTQKELESLSEVRDRVKNKLTTKSDKIVEPANRMKDVRKLAKVVAIKNAIKSHKSYKRIVTPKCSDNVSMDDDSSDGLADEINKDAKEEEESLKKDDSSNNQPEASSSSDIMSSSTLDELPKEESELKCEEMVASSTTVESEPVKPKEPSLESAIVNSENGDFLKKVLLNMIDPSVIKADNLMKMLEKVLDGKKFSKIKEIIEDKEEKVEEGEAGIVATIIPREEIEPTPSTSQLLNSPSTAKKQKRRLNELEKLNLDISEMFIRDSIMHATGKRQCTLQNKLAQVEISLSTAEETNKEKNLVEKPDTAPPMNIRKRRMSCVASHSTVEETKKEKDPVEKQDTAPMNIRKRRMSCAVIPVEQSVVVEAQGIRKRRKSIVPVSYEEYNDDEDSALEKTAPRSRARSRGRSRARSRVRESPSDGESSLEEERRQSLRKKPLQCVNKDEVAQNVRVVDETMKKSEGSSIEEVSSGNPKGSTEVVVAGKKDKLKKIPKNTNRNLHSVAENRFVCVICSSTHKLIVPHYVHNHPKHEVYISRLRNDLGNALINQTKPYQVATQNWNAVCLLCDQMKTTFHRADWISHYAKHTGEYFYSCSHCGKRLTEDTSANAHTKICSPGATVICRKPDCIEDGVFYIYICVVCCYVQINEENLVRHLKEEHHVRVTKDVNYKRVAIMQMPVKLTKQQKSAPTPPLEAIEKKGVATSKEGATDMGAFILPKEENAQLDRDALELMNNISFSNTESTRPPTVSMADRLNERFNSVRERERLMEMDQCNEDEDTEVEENSQDGTLNLQQIESECQMELDSIKLEEYRVESPRKTPSSIRATDKGDFETDTALNASPDDTTANQSLTNGDAASNVNATDEQDDEDLWEDCDSNDKITVDKNKTPTKSKHIGDTINRLYDSIALQNNKISPKKSDSSSSLSITVSNSLTTRASGHEESSNNTNSSENVSSSIKAKQINSTAANATNSNDNDDDNDDGEAVLVIDEEDIGEEPTLCRIDNIGYSIKKKEITFICLLETCPFQSENYVSFQTHVEGIRDCKWEGFCHICRKEVEVDMPSYPLTIEMRHMKNDHLKEYMSDLPPVRPMIKLARLPGDKLSKISVGVPKAASVTFRNQQSIGIKIANIVSAADPKASATFTESQSNIRNNASSILQIANVISGSPVAKVTGTNPDDAVQMTSQELLNDALPDKVRPWIESQLRKTPEAAAAMLKDISLYALYKCMEKSCQFSSSCEPLMVKHLQAHQHLSKSNGWLDCAYCTEVAPTIDKLVKHIYSEHGLSLYQCPYCFYRTISVYSCVSHVRYYHGRSDQPERLLKCKGKTSVASANMNVLLQLRQKYVRPLTCKECRQSMYTVQDFRKHLTDEHPGLGFICAICHQTVLKTALANHLATHKIGIYECIYCTYGTFTEEEIRNHVHRMHPTKWLYICARSRNQQPGITANQARTMPHTIDETYIGPLKVPLDKSIIETCPFTPDELKTASLSAIELATNPIPPIMCAKPPQSAVTQAQIDEAAIKWTRATGKEGRALYQCAYNGCVETSEDSMCFSVHLAQHSVHEAKCAHCQIEFNKIVGLMKHLKIHMPHRYFCFYCLFTSVDVEQCNKHMSYFHKISNLITFPLNPHSHNVDNSFFVVLPRGLSEENVAKFGATLVERANETPTDTKKVYFRNEIHLLPKQQIFSENISCGHCTYSTKIRTNLARHFAIHNTDSSAPNKDPVNPVPCLNQAEKHFDKMTNLAFASSDERVQILLPVHIPQEKRFVCNATDCRYQCQTSEGLQCHLSTLHADEKDYKCYHCPHKLVGAMDVEAVLNHLRMHQEQLYKCTLCKFIHYCKKAMENHAFKEHANKGAIQVITRKPAAVTPKSAAAAAAASTKWQCSQCKVIMPTKADITAHTLTVHNIDHQFACKRCGFSSDMKNVMTMHAKDNHPLQQLQIVLNYVRVNESKNAETAPLWKRDDPNKVKHIRGILFDDCEEDKLPPPNNNGTTSRMAATQNGNTNNAVVLLVDSSDEDNDATANKSNKQAPKNVETPMAAKRPQPKDAGEKEIQEVAAAKRPCLNRSPPPLALIEAGLPSIKCFYCTFRCESLNIMKKHQFQTHDKPLLNVYFAKIPTLSTRRQMNNGKNNTASVIATTTATNSEVNLTTENPSRAEVDIAKILVTSTSVTDTTSKDNNTIAEKDPLPVTTQSEDSFIKALTQKSRMVQYLCGHCPRKDFSVTDLFRHWKEIHRVQGTNKSHNGRPFNFKISKHVRCMYCSRVGPVGDIIQHQIKYHASKDYGVLEPADTQKCGLCFYRGNKSEQTIHYKAEHDIKTDCTEIQMHKLTDKAIEQMLEIKAATPMKCNACPYVVHEEKEFFQHWDEKHSDSPHPKYTNVISEIEYVCPQCKFYSEDETKHYIHMNSHMPKYRCTECSQCFKIQKTLQEHLRAEHGVDKLDWREVEADEYVMLLEKIRLIFPNGLCLTKKEVAGTVYGDLEEGINLLSSLSKPQRRSRRNTITSISDRGSSTSRDQEVSCGETIVVIDNGDGPINVDSDEPSKVDSDDAPIEKAKIDLSKVYTNYHVGGKVVKMTVEDYSLYVNIFPTVALEFCSIKEYLPSLKKL